MRDHVCVTPARVVVPTREPRITAIVLTHRREHELARTLRLAPRVWREAGGLRGWRRTLAGLPWTLRERRPIPMRVDAMRRVVEATERIARRQARRQQR
ncbi:glycosyltransferase, group 2 family [Burkholderia thailandensis MSMB121]|nr:glycosyltransferase, group 2 family [Burkholderia thailandensis MSMB121]ATF33661.1 hypothetical protein CO709_10375 [Burkholderia thailandensis]